MEPFPHLSLPVRDLDESRHFYVDVLGCEPGRVRRELGCLDVWFYGLQLTLQCMPEQVLPAAQQAGRHFGVALAPDDLTTIIDRLSTANATWAEVLDTDATGALSGKRSAKVLDPSGNVIEFKSYPNDRASLDT